MAVYGAEVEEFAQEITEGADEIVLDWSIEAAYHIAWAFYCVHRLKILGTVLKAPNGQTDVVEPALRQAWRELLYVRFKRLDPQVMATDIRRKVTLSKSGALIHEHENKFTIGAYQRGLGSSDTGTPGSVYQGRPSNEAARKHLRLRARRARQFSKPKNTGIGK